jgi:hypothetical protein
MMTQQPSCQSKEQQKYKNTTIPNQDMQHQDKNETKHKITISLITTKYREGGGRGTKNINVIPL